MRVAFRVDAAPHIGIGHFVRCVTLADALREGGASIRFVCRHLSTHLHAQLEERGHELALLSPAGEPHDADLAHSEWLGVSQVADAAATIDALSPGDWDWIVVDHYGLDARWQSTVRAASRRIMAVDDTADRPHDCDLLLDQNLFPDMSTRYSGLLPDGCRTLLGPRFALLRKEFTNLRDATPVRAGGVRRVLVLLGGSDVRNDTEKALRAILLLPEPRPVVDVVIGSDHPDPARIAEICATHGFSCHVQVANVAELMAAADLAIGATGSTSWERCCLGLPTICVTTADNQAPIAEGLAMTGAIINLRDSAAVTARCLAGVISRLRSNPEELAALSSAARELVDGRGVERVCEALAA